MSGVEIILTCVLEGLDGELTIRLSSPVILRMRLHELKRFSKYLRGQVKEKRQWSAESVRSHS